jgi:DNA-binding transcriptional MerR regulator
MALMAIGELARRTGIPATTIRYYERIGLLPVAHRSGGKRRYGLESVVTLRRLALGKALGFTLVELRALAQSNGLEWHARARAKLAALRGDIDRASRSANMLEQLLDCGCKRLSTCSKWIDPSIIQ